MGKSAPPPAPFDLVNSYARLRGESVELVLNGPKAPGIEQCTEAVLRKGGTKVVGRAVVDDGPLGRRVVVTVGRDLLADGRWVVRLRGGDGDPVATRTRLLVQGDRPVVLLWGGSDPESRLPVPRDRSTAAGSASGAGSDVRATVVRAGSRALDAALSPLPPQRRDRARQGARRVARRLLG
ncbi:hypothetical protein GCM10009737_26530 [Nocardioides lentus]|uniref:Uncharacterized protein n=1 Tax=Nocardioides lentus TaxID=338077 RepID=A0ABN2PLF6_9ACTN